jgi:E3 ubiquitin-protein ligase RBBP6
MSYIHFKSLAKINYDKITFDGVSLTLAQLKKNVVEKSKFIKTNDFDLEITNADTGEGKFFFLVINL